MPVVVRASLPTMLAFIYPLVVIIVFILPVAMEIGSTLFSDGIGKSMISHTQTAPAILSFSHHYSKHVRKPSSASVHEMTSNASASSADISLRLLKEHRGPLSHSILSYFLKDFTSDPARDMETGGDGTSHSTHGAGMTYGTSDLSSSTRIGSIRSDHDATSSSEDSERGSGPAGGASAHTAVDAHADVDVDVNSNSSSNRNSNKWHSDGDFILSSNGVDVLFLETRTMESVEPTDSSNTEWRLMSDCAARNGIVNASHLNMEKWTALESFHCSNRTGAMEVASGTVPGVVKEMKLFLDDEANTIVLTFFAKRRIDFIDSYFVEQWKMTLGAEVAYVFRRYQLPVMQPVLSMTVISKDMFAVALEGDSRWFRLLNLTSLAFSAPHSGQLFRELQPAYDIHDLIRHQKGAHFFPGPALPTDDDTIEKRKILRIAAVDARMLVLVDYVVYKMLPNARTPTRSLLSGYVCTIESVGDESFSTHRLFSHALTDHVELVRSEDEEHEGPSYVESSHAFDLALSTNSVQKKASDGGVLLVHSVIDEVYVSYLDAPTRRNAHIEKPSALSLAEPFIYDFVTASNDNDIIAFMSDTQGMIFTRTADSSGRDELWSYSYVVNIPESLSSDTFQVGAIFRPGQVNSGAYLVLRTQAGEMVSYLIPSTVPIDSSEDAFAYPLDDVNGALATLLKSGIFELIVVSVIVMIAALPFLCFLNAIRRRPRQQAVPQRMIFPATRAPE